MVDVVADLAAARVLTGVKGVGRLVLRKDNDAGADDGGLPWDARRCAREGGVIFGTVGNDASVSGGRITAESLGCLVGV